MEESKKEVRRALVERRLALAPEEVDALSRAIVERVRATPCYAAARTVMAYLSFRQEVETAGLLRAALAGGKRVVVPCCRREDLTIIPAEIKNLEQDLVPGTWGILEPRPESLRPLAPAEIDLVVVPGVAFDPRGNRLGYGAGYYDRFLPLLNPRATTVALAYEFQILPELQPEPHDCPVQYIASEERLIDCRQVRSARH